MEQFRSVIEKYETKDQYGTDHNGFYDLDQIFQAGIFPKPGIKAKIEKGKRSANKYKRQKIQIVFVVIRCYHTIKSQDKGQVQGGEAKKNVHKKKDGPSKFQ